MKIVLIFIGLLGVALGQFGGLLGGNKPAIPPLISNVGSGITDTLGKLAPKDFSSFSSAFNKVYSTAEEQLQRNNIFEGTKTQIDEFNKLYQSGKQTFLQSVNVFSDLLNEEFNKQLNGFGRNIKSTVPLTHKLFQKDETKPIPESINWVEKGGVTPVKYQHLCAGCWAFSAAAAIEGHNFVKTGKLHELSPQNLIDCCGSLGNTGCDGGILDIAFEYVKQNGINEYDTYPFENKTATCRYDSNSIAAKCKGYISVPQGDEVALEAAVATLGPVAVAVDAGKPSFQHYGDGVYYDPKCSNKPEDMNHAVVLVGYGKEQNGQKYWLLKNSYGTSWGKDGYFKLAKDAKNHCGVANFAVYPEL